MKRTSRSIALPAIFFALTLAGAAAAAERPSAERPNLRRSNVAQKRIRMTREQAETFYAVHKERPFFGELVEFMTSGPVVVQVLEGDNAIARNREVMGATIRLTPTRVRSARPMPARSAKTPCTAPTRRKRRWWKSPSSFPAMRLWARPCTHKRYPVN